MSSIFLGNFRFCPSPPHPPSLPPSPMCSKILTFLSLSLSLFFHLKWYFSFYDFWLPKERRLFALCSEVMTEISHRKKYLRKVYDFPSFSFAKKYITISTTICVDNSQRSKINKIKQSFYLKHCHSYDWKIYETLL